MSNITDPPSRTKPTVAAAARWRHVTLAVGLVGAYLIAFFLSYSFVGVSATALAIIPVSLVAWFWGLRAALLAALFSFPLNIILLIAARAPLTDWDAFVREGGTHGAVVTFVSALTTGRLSDLRRRLKQKLGEHDRIEAALQELEDKNRALLAATRDLVFQIRRDGTFRQFTASQEVKPYVPPETFLGRPVREIMPAEIADQAMRAIDRALQTGEVQRFEYELVIDGKARAWEARVATSGGDEVLAVVHEITEHKRVIAALQESEQRYRALFTEAQRQAQELTLLSQVRTAIARELEPPAIVRAVVEAIAETFGYAQVSLYLLQGDLLILQHQVGYEQVIPQIPVAQGVSGRAVRSEQPLLIEDVHTDPDFLGAMEGLVSEVCVPLFVRGQVVGTLNVESTGEVRLTQADLTLVVALGEHVGLALERARLYDELRESERRFRTLIEKSSVAVTLVNADGVATYESPVVERILGYKPEERVGHNSFELIHPDDLSQNARLFEQLVQRPGASVTAQFRFQHKDGSWRWIDVTGSNWLNDPTLQSIVVNYHDLTERKQAEEALREAEAKYRTLVEQIPAVTYIASYEDPARTLFVSPQIETLLGWSPEEWMADPKYWIRQLHPDDRERVLALIRAARARENDQPFIAEYRLFSRDGSEVWVRDQASLMWDAKGQPYCLQGIMLDITDRKRMETIERDQRSLAEALRDTSAALTSTLDFDEVVERIMVNVGQVVPHETATLFLIEMGAAHAARSRDNTGGGLDRSMAGLRVEIAQAPDLQHMIATGQPFIIPDTRTFAGWIDFPETRWVRSHVSAPIQIKGDVIGFLNLDSTTPGFFTTAAALRLHAFADQAAIAIANARLLEETRQRARELAGLYETTRDLATHLDLPALLQTITERAVNLLQSAGGGIYLYEPAEQTLRLAVAQGASVKIGTTLRLTEGMAGRVAQSRQALIVDDYRTWEGRSQQYDGLPIGAVVEVPMLYSDQLIGVLVVQESGEAKRKYTEADARLLSLFAGQAAIAIANARLLEEVSQRLRELEAVNKVSTTLRVAQTLDEILLRLLDETLSILIADSGAIWLYDAARNDLREAVSRGWLGQLSSDPALLRQGIVEHVLATGEPFVTREFSQAMRTREALRPQIPVGWGGACLPIRSAQEVVGVLFVSIQLPREMTPAEIRLLTTLSEIAGNAIHRTRLHEQTERRLQRLTALHLIDSTISSGLELHLTLDVLLTHVMAQLRIDAASILLLDPITQMLQYAAGQGFRTENIQHTHLRMGDDFAGQVGLERRRVFIPNLKEVEDEFARHRLLALENFSSYLGLPLIAKGQVKGVLELFHRQPLQPDIEWLEFLDTLAGQAAIAVENASLFTELQRSNNELVVAYDATIEGWSRALDLRDRETEGHTRRVTDLTVRLARALSVSEEQLGHIHRGALLHDIGKMGIPDSVLHKPGPLAVEEQAIMQRHPQYAYEMLSPISYLRPALDIPYCHHEKWDGTGYPRGLKGEQIPLAARIFAVVDVWDALLSDRPYRPGWPEATVLDHVQENAGSHFDPEIVAVFLSMMR